MSARYVVTIAHGRKVRETDRCGDQRQKRRKGHKVRLPPLALGVLVALDELGEEEAPEFLGVQELGAG
jgi:hypothetical protein